MIMSEKGKKKLHKRIQIGYLLCIIGVVFLSCVFLIGTRYNLNDIERDANETISFLKNVCQKYSNYQMGDLTQDLQEQINAVDMLSSYVDKGENMDADSLLAFAENLSLTGAIVLGEHLEMIAFVDRNGRTSEALLHYIERENDLAGMQQNPVENYADQIQIGIRTYNYAVSFAEDTKDVVICYTDVTGLKNDRNELSLQTLVQGNSFRKNAVVVITDGEVVLGTNSEDLQGLSVAQCPFTNVNASGTTNAGDSLIRLRNGRQIWYGTHALYHDYYLYAFYKDSEVFSGRWLYMLITLVGYLFVSLIILNQQQRNEKVLLGKMQKEYHLIRTIGTIYSTNLLIQLDENRWEAVIATEEVRVLLGGESRADAMLNKICEHLVHPDHRQGFAEFTDLFTLRKRLKGEKFLGFSFEGIEGRWYQSLLIPQEPDEIGEVHAVMLVFRNVSEQKRKEMEYQEKLRLTTLEAERANAAKTDFLRRMSHDVRTPINGILGMADIGKRNLSDEEKVVDCLDKITSASEFLLDLVNDVLDMSKLESGEIRLSEEPFDLREQLRDMVDMIDTQAQSRHLTFEREILAGTHWHLIGSPVHVRQVLMNILSNAVKYNRENGSITASCREVSVDDKYVLFEFVCADTGIGMSPEFQKHAYDTFAQEHDHARTVYSGTGLGLSIAKKLVDCMGGSIEFVSELGMGTTFTVRLRFRMDEQYERDLPVTEETETSLKGAHILVVEDNELNMEIAEYMLTEKGATVVKATDGWQAVNLFAASESGTFTCVLMDIMMPVMNGLEATRKIRALNRPDADTVPIIAMSANSFSDDIANSLAAGMNAHLSKPLDFDNVCVEIRKYSG